MPAFSEYLFLCKGYPKVIGGTSGIGVGLLDPGYYMRISCVSGFDDLALKNLHIVQHIFADTIESRVSGVIRYEIGAVWGRWHGLVKGRNT